MPLLLRRIVAAASSVKDGATPVRQRDVAMTERTRAWLGVSFTGITPAIISRYNLSVTEGLLLATVQAGSPADKAGLKVGDVIHIKGNTTDMELAVSSMQINRIDVTQAGAGTSVGVKVSGRVRRGDIVYKVIPAKTS